jgi:hypothetical protein
MIDEDDFCSRKLAIPNSLEALSWLQSQENAFRTFGGNGIRKGFAGKRALDFVNRLYKHGAKGVVAVGVSKGHGEWVRKETITYGLPETDSIEATDTLIVELPNDLSARAAIIQQWVNTFGRRKWDVPVDVGQRYLLFWWD